MSIKISKYNYLYEELINTTSFTINKNQFYVKVLYGGSEKNIFIDATEAKNNTLFFKLFNDKEFSDEVAGFYSFDISMLKQCYSTVNSLKIKSYKIPFEFLVKVKNENELYSIVENNYDSLDIPITQLSILDFMAISLKKPISKNKIINNLINEH